MKPYGRGQEVMKHWIQVALVLLGVVFIIWGITFYMNHRPGVVRKEVYLIPKGFNQCGAIVYNIKEAPNLQLKNGIITYRIPKDGIFQTSSPSDFGWASKNSSGYHDVSFYWVDKKGHRLGKIPELEIANGGEGFYAGTFPDGTYINVAYSPLAIGQGAQDMTCIHLESELTLKKMMNKK